MSEEQHLALMLMLMRIYDAVVAGLPEDKAEALLEVHLNGAILGPVPSYTGEHGTVADEDDDGAADEEDEDTSNL